MPAIAGALIVATFIAYLALSAPFDSDWRARDMQAYWSAAERIRAGGNPYAQVAELPYQYAPWFAYLWVPVTFLPRQLVEWMWLLVLVGCVGWLTLPFLRSYTGVLIAMLLIPQVMEYAWIGNVDALMLVGLTFINRRAGPLFVGLAASLKITPIAFVGVYLVRREWRRAAVAVGCAALLWLPVLFFDLSGPRTRVGEPTPYSLWNYGAAVALVSYGLILVVSAIATWRDRRVAGLGAGLLAMYGNPVVNLYNVGYLVVVGHTALIDE
jgi:hypothetical protein